jgi:hypothetical protein
VSALANHGPGLRNQSDFDELFDNIADAKWTQSVVGGIADSYSAGLGSFPSGSTVSFCACDVVVTWFLAKEQFRVRFSTGALVGERYAYKRVVFQSPKFAEGVQRGRYLWLASTYLG